MKKSTILAIVLVIVIILGAWYYFYTPGNSNNQVNGPSGGVVVKGSNSTDYFPSNNTLGNEYLINITSSGFYPNNITIKVGDTLVWTDLGSTPSWVASAKHPTHTLYPGADYNESGSYQGSEACVSEGKPKTGAFDSCRGLITGDKYSFTFNYNGTFYYHDHLMAKHFGKIIVTN